MSYRPFADLGDALQRADIERVLAEDQLIIDRRRAQEQARLDGQAAQRKVKAQRKANRERREQ